MQKSRIYLAGVGGQGTLTATNLLALMAVDKNLPVSSGEIHGMAQRGGIVESTVLLGDYLSPKIDYGESDILLGFEPLETLRALPYLKSEGLIISNLDPIIPIGVSLEKETYPQIQEIKEKVLACSTLAYFLYCKDLASKAGTVQSANTVLLGALCATEDSPFTLDDLKQAIEKYLPQKIVEINLKACQFGYDNLQN